MTIERRTCRGPADFPAISDFLYSLYQPYNGDHSWLQPMWEYAYTHALFDDASVGKIGLWEESGTIVGVALYELYLGEAFFPVHPDHAHLKPEMLEYAELNLTGTTDDGERRLRVFVSEFDTDFERVVRARGYEKEPRAHRPMSRFEIRDPFPSIDVPDGFRLMSLADDNDLVKLDRVLWRGFNHPGEPPEDDLAGRKKMQSGPHFRKDLSMVVEAPDGAFAAFGGLWFDPVNNLGYVEPVATDPDYRRRGLATAAVLEGIRRCGDLGATEAYVGTDLPVYLAMGFETLHVLNAWTRTITEVDE